MSLPIIVGGAAALGLLFYAMNSKAAPPGLGGKKGKVAPPLPTKATPDFKPEAAVVFKPEPKKPVAQVDPADTVDLIKAGAVQVATEATGAQVFKRPDGGLVTVMAPVEVTSAGATGQAVVKTQSSALNIRKGPSSSTAIAGSAPKGTVLNITGATVSGPGSKLGWAPVMTLSGVQGFAAVDYLEMGS